MSAMGPGVRGRTAKTKKDSKCGPFLVGSTLAQVTPRLRLALFRIAGLEEACDRACRTGDDEHCPDLEENVHDSPRYAERFLICDETVRSCTVVKKNASNRLWMSVCLTFRSKK
jgi:hypothetical protein